MKPEPMTLRYAEAFHNFGLHASQVDGGVRAQSSKTLSMLPRITSNYIPLSPVVMQFQYYKTPAGAKEISYRTRPITLEVYHSADAYQNKDPERSIKLSTLLGNNPEKAVLTLRDFLDHELKEQLVPVNNQNRITLMYLLLYKSKDIAGVITPGVRFMGEQIYYEYMRESVPLSHILLAFLRTDADYQKAPGSPSFKLSEAIENAKDEDVSINMLAELYNIKLNA